MFAIILVTKLYVENKCVKSKEGLSEVKIANLIIAIRLVWTVDYYCSEIKTLLCCCQEEVTWQLIVEGDLLRDMYKARDGHCRTWGDVSKWIIVTRVSRYECLL